MLAVGFARNGLGFVKLFVPSGVPLPVLFMVVPIEILSFLLRPVTLALRLFGNMLGGHVDLFFGNVSAALAQWRDGKVKVLAVLDKQRSPQMPTVPTTAEAGIVITQA